MTAMDSLVTTDWLAAELGAADLVIVDCTVLLQLGDQGYVSESGRANFEAGHIPGAVFAELDDLCDRDNDLRWAMPSPGHFTAAAEALGIADDTRVVLYDDNQTMWAARVWWMLGWVGFDRAALLDGGMKAWRCEGRDIETGPSLPAPAAAGSLSIELRPERIADRHEMLAAVDDGATCLIDALPGAVFRGEVQPYARPGHIPGALNLAATSMLDADTGRFNPADELATRFPDRPEARTVAY